MRRLPVIASVLLPQPPKAFSPPAGNLVLFLGSPPSIRLPINPNSASLLLSGVAPVISSAIIMIPGSAALALSGVAPTYAIQSGTFLTPSVGSLTLTADAPVVLVTEPVGWNIADAGPGFILS